MIARSLTEAYPAYEIDKRTRHKDILLGIATVVTLLYTSARRTPRIE